MPTIDQIAADVAELGKRFDTYGKVIGEQLGGLRTDVDALKAAPKSPSFVGAVTKWLGDNPVILHTLNAVVSMMLGALLSYVTGLTKVDVPVQVPGPPVPVIVREPADTSKIKTNVPADGGSAKPQ